MKKIVSFITVFGLMLTLAACSGGNTNETKLLRKGRGRKKKEE